MAIKTKVKRSKLTRKEAIKKFCSECMNWQTHLIRKCPDLACPLWTFRNGTEEESDVPIRTKKA